jgi:hypothetical protein
MKVTVGAKELKKRKLASPSPGGTNPPTQSSPSSCISAAGTPQRGSELGGGPCLESSFETGKSTGHSATHEFQLVLDGMIVFISTSCLQHEKKGIWMPNSVSSTCHLVNVKGLRALNEQNVT